MLLLFPAFHLKEGQTTPPKEVSLVHGSKTLRQSMKTSAVRQTLISLPHSSKGLQIPALTATGLDVIENKSNVCAKFAIKEKETEVLQISQGKLLLLSFT